MIRRWDKSKPPTGPWALNADSDQALGLIAWWPFANGGGKFVPAHVGLAHATMANVQARTLNANGAPCATFNGTSDGAQAAIDLSAYTKISVAFWASATNQSSSPLAVEYGNAQAGGFFAEWASGGDFYAGNVTTSLNYGRAVGASTSGATEHWLFTLDYTTTAGNNMETIYKNGVSMAVTQSQTNAQPGSLSNLTLNLMARNNGASLQTAGNMADFRIYNGIANAALLANAAYDPGTRFELMRPLRSRKWFTAGGGTVYQADVSETGSIADVLTAFLLLGASASESGTAADTAGALLVLGASLSDSGTAADTAGATLSLPGATSETGTAADTVAGQITLTAALSESGTAVDTAAGSLVLSGGASEAGSVSDTWAGALVLPGAASEAGSLSDSWAGALVLIASLAESGSAQDIITGQGGASLVPAPWVLDAPGDDRLLIAQAASRVMVVSPQSRVLH